MSRFIYAVEKTDSNSKCSIGARNAEYFSKLQSAKDYATHTFSDKQDLRIDAFLDDTAKVYDAKEGHADYADAHAWITKLAVNTK